MQGWIKDYRKELESDIWMMPPLYHRVWQYLKYKVNHEPRKVPQKNGAYITIEKGETITSMRQIAESVKWMEYGVEKVPSSKTIRDVLNVLQNFGMITRESNSLGTRIKVVNYELYQGSINGESNNEETAKKQQLPTNKNDKNDKNKEYGHLFEHLWLLYPRKKGKGNVSDTQKRRLYEIGKDHMERCISRFKKEMEAEARPLDKYPYGSTFFNSGYIDYLDENYEPQHKDKSASGELIR